MAKRKENTTLQTNLKCLMIMLHEKNQILRVFYIYYHTVY